MSQKRRVPCITSSSSADDAIHTDALDTVTVGMGAVDASITDSGSSSSGEEEQPQPSLEDLMTLHSLLDEEAEEIDD